MDSMRLSYDIRLDDLYALQRHYYDSTPSVRRAVRLRQGIGVLLALCIMFAGWRYYPWDAWVFYASGGILVLFFLFAAPFLWRWNHMRCIRRQYSGPASKGLLGSHLMEIAGDDLISTNSDRQLRTRISSLVRVDEDEDRVYIFTTPFNIHVIPHETVVEGDVDQLVAILRDRMAVTASGAPLSEAVRQSTNSGNGRR
jgi:hypothetical protein